MSLTNFVQLQLQSGITAVASTMTVLSPVAPFKLPDASGTLVLLDGLAKPSKAEVVTYTGVTDNGNGTHTFTGLGRGAESSTAQVWPAQAYVIESVTAGMLAAMLAAKQDAGSNLAALSGLTGEADRVPYFTGAGALSLATLTSLARTLLDDTTQSGMQSTLGLVKQSSVTDTTAGALMTVGAFGLGEAASVLSNDWNAITANGFYRNSLGTAVGIPRADGLYSMIHSAYNASNAWQMATETFDPTPNTYPTYIRVREGGVWGAWVEVFTSGSILGAVSQSGGVPTGAIIEQGSNANGQYTRWADGTQICTCVISAGAWSAYASISGTWVYPAVFTGPTPCVQATELTGGPHAYNGGAFSPGYNAVGWAVGGIYSGSGALISMSVTGRWF